MKSLSAISSYLLGSLVFGAIAQIETRKQYVRWRVVLVTLLQTVSLLVCAALAQSHEVSNRPSSDHNIFSSGSPKKNTKGDDNYLDLLPIGLLAFQAAGQVTLSRILSHSDLPTIVISTLYHDFVAGQLHAPGDFKESLAVAREEKCFWNKVKAFKHNILQVSENRQKRQLYRVGAISSLIQGVSLAALVFKKGHLAACLWLAFGVKTILCLVVIAWHPVEQEDISV